MCGLKKKMEKPIMEHNSSNDYQRGLYVFVALVALSLIEIGVALFFTSNLALGAIILAKAGLVLYYYMHVGRLAGGDDETGNRASAPYKTGTNRLGLWLFLVSDAFVFAGLLVTRFSLLGLTRPHLNQTLGLAVSIVLLVSSFFANRAEVAAEKGDRKRLLTSTLITLVLGLVFLLGVVFVEWPAAAREGITPSSGVGGAVFYMMTGMHAFHVFTGLIFLALIYRNARKNLYSAEKHWQVEAGVVYWHFVDVVWMFFYPALYLIGLVV
jgi:cytochrome c oxidase subunit 3